MFPRASRLLNSKDAFHHFVSSKVVVYTSVKQLLGWAGHLPDHLADLAARAPTLENVTVVAPQTT